MTSATIKKIVIARRNNIEIGPVIARGITFLFGHLFLAPFTKLIIAMIKHGIKINKIAQIIKATAIHIKIPNMPIRMVTKNAPINAMLILYVFYVLIATILLRISQFLGSGVIKTILVLYTSFLINLNSQK